MATVLAMPGVAVADTYWHPTNNEAGVKAYPGHFKSSQTRDQVRAEAANAVRDGGDTRMRAGNYPAVKSTGPEKTRQQVIDELTKETPSQRDARNQAMAG
nr:DUF4148 domain-containing protein [Comamonas thiooxydans]